MSYLTRISKKIFTSKPITLLISLLALTAAPFVTTGTAYAFPSQCPSNTVCLFENSQFGGSSYQVYIYSSPTQCLYAYGMTYYDGNGVLRSRVSSVINNTSHLITYYESPSCSNSPAYLNDGTYSYRTNLHYDSWTSPQFVEVNDKIKSFKVY
jgi:hypothetical protein